MKFPILAIASAVLAATMVSAQSAPPAASRSALNPRTVVANNNATGLADNARAQSSLHKRVEEMGTTLTRMHALLKQLQARAAAGGAKDASAKINLEMWGLMLSDLDRQYEQLKAASRTREELESRRSAMYKQAEQKAAAEAKLANGKFVPKQAAPNADGAAPADAAGSASSSPAQPAAEQAPAPAPAASSPN